VLTDTATDPPAALAVADDSALEGSDLRFAVDLSEPVPRNDVRVTATTSVWTAGDADFTATSETVEIPAGQTQVGFVVKTTDDTDDEPADPGR